MAISFPNDDEFWQMFSGPQKGVCAAITWDEVLIPGRPFSHSRIGEGYTTEKVEKTPEGRTRVTPDKTTHMCLEGRGHGGPHTCDCGFEWIISKRLPQEALFRMRRKR